MEMNLLCRSGDVRNGGHSTTSGMACSSIRQLILEPFLYTLSAPPGFRFLGYISNSFSHEKLPVIKTFLSLIFLIRLSHCVWQNELPAGEAGWPLSGLCSTHIFALNLLCLCTCKWYLLRSISHLLNRVFSSVFNLFWLPVKTEPSCTYWKDMYVVMSLKKKYKHLIGPR